MIVHFLLYFMNVRKISRVVEIPLLSPVLTSKSPLVIAAIQCKGAIKDNFTDFPIYNIYRMFNRFDRGCDKNYLRYFLLTRAV